MAYFIFTQGKYTHALWELLETVEREELAKEVYRNYRQRLDPSAVELVMVRARSEAEARERIQA